MNDGKRAGWRAIAIAVIGLFTAATPGVIGLMTALEDQGEEKADLGYELMRQRIEFLADRMDQTCEDVRELRALFLDVSSTISRSARASRAPASRPHHDAHGDEEAAAIDGLEATIDELNVLDSLPAPVEQATPLPRSLDLAIKEKRR